MKKEGKKINKWCHFSRNNPRTVYYYYNWLIGLFGYDNWEKGNALFKRQWESAKYSFDKMYGLVKGWSASQTTLTLILPEVKEADPEIEKIHHSISLLQDEKKQLEKRLKEKEEDMDKVIGELRQAAEELRRAKTFIDARVRTDDSEGDE